MSKNKIPQGQDTKHNRLKKLKNIDKDNKSKKESNMTQNQIAQLTTEEKKAYIKRECLL